MDSRARVKAVAIDLDALGDTQRLWQDWRQEAARRFRIELPALETELPNWEHLLERFAEVPVLTLPATSPAQLGEAAAQLPVSDWLAP